MFYWPDSGKEIQDYVSQCISCQRNKSQNRHPYGLLQPLPIPSMPFDSISMDFIVNLPESKGYNCLLTVTDRLTKMVRLIPCRTDATANDIADVFIDQIVKLHGIPKEIISDRDTKFNSDFWKSLMKSFNVELKMSTTNHPQHDGQSERSNRNVITTLRSYVNEGNTNWIQQLPFIEIYLNNCEQTSSQFSPYYANYARHPNFNGLFNTRSGSQVPSIQKYIKSIQSNWETIKMNLIRAQSHQKNYADRNRRTHPFKVNDMVYLMAKHIKPMSGVNKLNPVSRGPFRITKQINEVTFELELPPTWRIHNSFHVSLLKPAKFNDDWKFPLRKSVKIPEAEVMSDGTIEHEVEKIVDRRWKRRRYEYRVRWKGFGAESDTWEPIGNLKNASRLVEEYEKESIVRRNRFEERMKLNNLQTKDINTSKRLRFPLIINPDRVSSSQRCEAKTRINQQCRNRTRRSTMCQPHLVKYRNLRITNSGLREAGLGLFTGNKPIKRNHIIAPYTGVESLVPISGNYVLELNRRRWINANRSIDTAGFANECRSNDKKAGLCSGNNSKFTHNTRTGAVNIVSTKPIPAKTEVFVPYGKGYWKMIGR